jgi:hypothetical protein
MNSVIESGPFIIFRPQIANLAPAYCPVHPSISNSESNLNVNAHPSASSSHQVTPRPIRLFPFSTCPPLFTKSKHSFQHRQLPCLSIHSKRQNQPQCQCSSHCLIQPSQARFDSDTCPLPFTNSTHLFQTFLFFDSHSLRAL